MAIVRWRPRNEFISMQDEISRMFDDFLGSFRGEDGGMLVPPADVVEDKDKFTVAVELPGMKKEEIKLTLKNNTLTITGTKKRETEDNDDRHHRVERSFGSFSRTFSLPSMVIESKISAEFKDGILQVNLPKVEEAKPKEISISD